MVVVFSEGFIVKAMNTGFQLGFLINHVIQRMTPLNAHIVNYIQQNKIHNRPHHHLFFSMANQMLNTLPIAYVIGGSLFVVHGGLIDSVSPKTEPF